MSDLPDRIFAGPDAHWNADPIEPCMTEYVIGTEYNSLLARIAELEAERKWLRDWMGEAVSRVEQMGVLGLVDDADLFDVFREATELEAVVEKLPEWSGMQSAPKDREILVYRGDHGVFTARWASMDELVPKDLNGDPTEEYEDFEWWWSAEWGWLEGDLTPTRWMAMPDGPEAAEQAKGGG